VYVELEAIARSREIPAVARGSFVTVARSAGVPVSAEQLRGTFE
jgi:hypothetical protein